MYTYVYIYIYIHFFLNIQKSMCIYIYLYFQILYTKHPPKGLCYTIFRSIPGVWKNSQVAAAELLRDSVQWLGAEMQKRSPSCLSLVYGQTQWWKKSMWFINMKFCSSTWIKVVQVDLFECVFFDRRFGGKMRTWLPKFGMDRWKLFWQPVIYSMSTGVMIKNKAGLAILLPWRGLFAWFCFC